MPNGRSSFDPCQAPGLATVLTTRKSYLPSTVVHSRLVTKSPPLLALRCPWIHFSSLTDRRKALTAVAMASILAQ
jgi:hypothetical protein